MYSRVFAYKSSIFSEFSSKYYDKYTVFRSSECQYKYIFFTTVIFVTNQRQLSETKTAKAESNKGSEPRGGDGRGEGGEWRRGGVRAESQDSCTNRACAS